MNIQPTTLGMIPGKWTAAAALTETGTMNILSLATQTFTVLASTDDPLHFPVNDYTEASKTVTTTSGDVAVTYRLYEHLTYVAHPVDADYQSMNVKVPVRINGKDVDTTNVPILFATSIGGYMSSSNASSGRTGTPPAGSTDLPPGVVPGTLPPGVVPGMLPGMSNRNTDLALAAGYVVVEPGARGRDNQAADGTYYGKAPAAIVDLKAAVRYLRYNDAIMPGNANWIVSAGSSAGGALSALLGASGNNPLYDSYLKVLGAAEADDRIFASADFCPITDLEHADMSYEWEFGAVARNGALVLQTLSTQMASAFPAYLASLNLQGRNNFGAITADNYLQYLVQTYLIPSANKYLLALTDDARTTYLTAHTWISWSGSSASFSASDYLAYVGRKKGLPAFDAFDLSAPENSLFGNSTINARHFTNFSLRQVSGDTNAVLDSDLQTLVNLMNPMYFIAQGCSGCAPHWWIRHGSKDTDTALTVITNLATSLENQGKDVNTRLYWDAGHGANEDPEDFIAWIAQITGYQPASTSP